jgi:ATP-dependent Clp protease ATP-binding subunit ClpC
LYTIIDIEMKKLAKSLAEQGIKLELSQEARDLLIEKGYNPDFGARPLRRAIEQNVEDHLSESILRGEFKGVDLVKITRDGEKLRFESVNTKTEHPPAEPATAGGTAGAGGAGPAADAT